MEPGYLNTCTKETMKNKECWRSLFRFIFDYIARKPSDKNIEELLKKVKWVEFKEFAGYHEVGPFAYSALKKYNSLVPKNIYALLRNTYYYCLARGQYLQREFLNIFAIFNKNRVEFIPIKGMALLEDIYGHCPVRPMADIDVLIKEESVFRAKEIFNSLGFREELSGCREEYWRTSQVHIAFAGLRKYKGRAI
jgi:hypothetical protein